MKKIIGIIALLFISACSVIPEQTLYDEYGCGMYDKEDFYYQCVVANETLDVNVSRWHIRCEQEGGGVCVYQDSYAVISCNGWTYEETKKSCEERMNGLQAFVITQEEW